MSDQPHFTRVFRRIVGINPGIWRRQFRTPDRANTFRRSWASRRRAHPAAGWSRRWHHDATFSLDGGQPERLSNLLSQQGGLVGNTVGKITAAEAVRTQGTNLALKLIPYESRLVGRVLATAEKPGTTLPYVLSLVQVSKN